MENLPKIKTLTVKEVSAMMGICEEVIQAGLRENLFPWGYGIRTGETRWRYWVNARSFYLHEFGKDLT